MTSATHFSTYGPLRLDRNNGAFAGHQAEFWSGVEAQYPDLKLAIGCYLFCLERGTDIKPWYVGQTRNAKGFSGEVFEKHKRDIYNGILEKRRGSPLLFLFPLITPETGNFSNARASSKKVIDWLEITLMGFAYRRNSSISNIRDMTFLRNVQVLGLLGARRGRPYNEALAVRRALLTSPVAKRNSN